MKTIIKYNEKDFQDTEIAGWRVRLRHIHPMGFGCQEVTELLQRDQEKMGTAFKWRNYRFVVAGIARFLKMDSIICTKSI
jgi:hypothetical protein